VYYTDVDLARRYAVARVTIWRWAGEGRLPQPVKLGPNCTRWKGDEVEAAEGRWLAERDSLRNACRGEPEGAAP